MIGKFRYKNVDLFVKTNMTMKGELYFGDKDILSLLEQAYKQTNYQGATNKTIPEFLNYLRMNLVEKGIAPQKIVCENVIHDGGKVTEFKSEE